MTVGRAPKHEDLFRSTRELCYSGMSDREAVDAFVFDTRWKYAAGLLDFDPPGFVHTVFVDMRERLRRSDRPNRIFETVIEAARAAGLIGRKRVLGSTALYDAVATQDTVTLVRSALVALHGVVHADIAAEMRSGFDRVDDYKNPGKPRAIGTMKKHAMPSSIRSRSSSVKTASNAKTTSFESSAASPKPT
jgi:hypothetical protein